MHATRPASVPQAMHRPGPSRRWPTFALWAALAACPAQALTVTAEGVGAVGQDSISCGARGSCYNYTRSGSSVQIAQFNGDLGVLTSATLSGFNGSTTLNYASSRSGSARFQQSLTFGSASVWTGFSTTGTTAASSPLGNGSGQLPASQLSWVLGNGNLSAYAETFLNVNKSGGGPFSPVTSATATASAHTLTGRMTYSYLQHANASFTSGTDLNQLSLTAGEAFAIHALGGAADTTRLDTASLSCSGDCSAFSLDLSSFQDLVAGQSVQGLTSLVSGLAAGHYSAVYTLGFADDNAVGVGQRANALTLTLGGDAVAAVPEPASGALMLAGLAALGWRGHRRLARR